MEDDNQIESTYSRKEMVYLTKLYSKTKSFEEAIFFASQFVEKNPKLTKDERNIFANAFKNIITKRRSSWRILSKIEANETQNHKIVSVKEIKTRVEEEISEIVSLMINLIDEYLLKDIEDYENAVFYYKLKADYFRYIAEISKGRDKEEALKETEDNYQQAYVIAEEKLPLTNETRLGVILNYSVFLWEIKNSKQEAAVLAQNGFNQVYELLQEMEMNKAKESIILVQLLRENLMSWSKEIELGEVQEEENPNQEDDIEVEEEN